MSKEIIPAGPEKHIIYHFNSVCFNCHDILHNHLIDRACLFAPNTFNAMIHSTCNATVIKNSKETYYCRCAGGVVLNAYI